MIQTVRSLGMTAIQWDVDSLDWKGISPQEIQRRVLDRVQPGSIVLFHNAAENTPEALPGILESLLADGYRIVPISELLLQGDCFIDNSGRHITGLQLVRMLSSTINYNRVLGFNVTNVAVRY